MRCLMIRVLLLVVFAAGVDAQQPTEEVAQLQLYDAAQTGDAAQIRRLVASGADVNGFDLNRMTPLYVAAIHGKVGAINALGPVNTYLCASKMSTKWMKPMNITSSFSNRENIRR